LGRSVENHAFVARKLKFLRGYDSIIVSPDSARSVPRDRLLVIATGTQGERPAALSRLARGEHRDLDLEEGDRVILSSRIIPGQEKHVFALLDELERRGLDVHHRRSDPGVHVSGHACREEQRQLIELTRPRAFMAVHGTYHMLRAHGALAAESGVENVVLAENGDRVQLQSGQLKRVGRVPSGRVHIARREEVTPAMLQDRALLVELGVATVAFSLKAGRLNGMPEVDTRGFLSDEANADLCEDCADYVARDLRKASDLDPEDAEDRARRAVKRYFGKRLRRKPLVIALAVEVPR
ncbi:MAG: ribonuclease J, partial [Myxococcota bacterium]